MSCQPRRCRPWFKVLTLLGIWLASALASAQVSPPDLWTRREMPPGVSKPPEVLAAIAVDVDTALLKSDQANRLRLELPDRSALLVARSRFMRTPKGAVWSGSIQDEAVGHAGFSVSNQSVSGSVLGPDGRSFRLRWDAAGVHVLEEVDLRKVPREERAVPSRNPTPAAPPAPAPADCVDEGETEIDVMVVHTADARVAAGSQDALEADVYLAVEQANQAYVNSGVAQRLRLVHVGEVPYAESGDSITDRDRLASPSDGFIDGVHDLRNDHGADLVVLVTESLEACGRSFQMTTVNHAFEAQAFAVVRRRCMSLAGLTSLAHELGHLMGARHDWVEEPFTVPPFTFNRGHIQAQVTTGTPWRTLMAYDTPCTTACPRLLQISNPQVSINGDPTGVGTGPQQEDNRRALDATARTVAGFRCANSLRQDVWMKDTWSDTGAVPDPVQAGKPMWESPSIWVRNTQDPLRVHQHEHQNPVDGQVNFIYVKVYNGGQQATGQVDVRVANASVGLSWPGSWSPVPASAAITLAGGQASIVEVPWSPPAAGHYCLLVRWISGTDPMTTPETADIEANVRGNNNIVWRNVNVIELPQAEASGLASSSGARFEVPGVESGAEFVLGIEPVLANRPRAGVPDFLDVGKVTLLLDERLLAAWRRASLRGRGVEFDGRVVTVRDPRGAQLTLDGLKGIGEAHIRFEVTRRDRAASQVHAWRVIQSRRTDTGLEPIGGITYLVRTRPP